MLDYIRGGDSFKNTYASNGCPDRSADGMFSWLKNKKCKHGKIASLPDVPGILLFMSGHVGVYIGGGYAIEARGFNYGVVKTKVSGRGWKNWAYMPASLLDYGNSDVPETVSPKPRELGDRILKSGSEGEDVAKLQEYLVQIGYDIGTFGAKKNGVDGDYGELTVKAVKNFQRENGLDDDGEYGPKTHSAMLLAIRNASQASDKSTFQIIVTGKSVNVRSKPNTVTGKIQYVVHQEDELTAVGTDSATNWFVLSDGNYISNKYIKLK